MALVFGACKKKKTSYHQYVYYNINSTVAGGGNITFTGDAQNGSDPILDCGILLSTISGATVDNALQKVSLGAIGSYVTFNHTFFHLNVSSKYYLKAYVQDNNGYTYSNETTNTTRCMTLDSLYAPYRITTDSTIVIYGKNFGTNVKNITVGFQFTDGESNAYPTFITNNTLNVKLPLRIEGYTSGTKMGIGVSRNDSICNCANDGDSRFIVTYK